MSSNRNPLRYAHLLPSHRARLLFVAAALAIFFSRDARARIFSAPDSVEAFGAFEIVTCASKLAGTDYVLNYRGAPYSFDGKSGMFGDSTARYKTFNAMFTFAVGTPAILVNVGDPNNNGATRPLQTLRTFGVPSNIADDRIKSKEMMIVTELTTGRWYMLPIRRSIERYN